MQKSEAQQILTRNNFTLLPPRLEWYVANSPGNTLTTSRNSLMASDSDYFRLTFNRLVFDSLPNTKVGRRPTNMMFTNDTGQVEVTKLDSLFINWNNITNQPTIPSAQVNSDWNSVSGLSQILNKPVLFDGVFASLTSKPTTLGGYGITDATSNARSAISITTTGTSGASTYNSTSGVLNIPVYANSGGTVTSVGLTSTDFSVSGSPVTTSGNITANLNTSGISAGTYMGATFNSKGIATAGMNPTIDTISTSRAFNTAYQMSTTKYTDIRVSVQISCALSLSGGNGGSVFLEWSADGSTNWTFAGQVPSSNTGTLTIGLNTVQIGGGQLTALIPPSYYWRVRTSNTTGTPTYTLLGGQKITY